MYLIGQLFLYLFMLVLLTSSVCLVLATAYTIYQIYDDLAVWLRRR